VLLRRAGGQPLEADTAVSNRQGTQQDAVTIRRATSADLPTIAELDERVTRLPKTEYWRDLVDRFSEHKGGAMFVAEAGGRVVGFIIGEIRAWEFGSPPCGWIFGVNIEPEFREHAVASTLFNAITDFFRSSGVTTVRTMIRRDYILLLSFFRSMGLRAGPFVELEKDLDE
jgi:ribosomal protein S18 acetylase RimI-like enzyme